MKNYLTASEAIIDLHERGYCSDFQLKGNDLLLLQEKLFVRAGDFQVIECHHFFEKNKTIKTSVYGVLALSQNKMGILIRHHTKYNQHTSPILKKKSGSVKMAVANALNNLLN